MRLYSDVVSQYLDFAEHARDASPSLAGWAQGVAEDDEVRDLIAGLPAIKQQPNLVFAAARWTGLATPTSYAALRAHLLAHWDEVAATAMARATQTNEVGRSATLLPAFARVAAETGSPLALVEVGASGGLCLFPDRYSYRYEIADDPAGARVHQIAGPPGSRTLSCRVGGPAPLPTRLPAIGWRAGLDLHPMDLTDPDARAWLGTLVWPEETDRRAQLEAAMAQTVPLLDPDRPLVRAGDLLTDLDAVLDEVPDGHRAVVFHTAVIAYLTPEDRVRFADQMASRVNDDRCSWVSNEAPAVLPGVLDGVPGGVEQAERSTDFVLGVDGSAIAFTHGHGRSLRWLTADR